MTIRIKQMCCVQDAESFLYLITLKYFVFATMSKKTAHYIPFAEQIKTQHNYNL